MRWKTKTRQWLKIATWVFIVLTVVTPLFGIGSIVCSINYKNTMQKKFEVIENCNYRNNNCFVLNLLAYLGLR